MANPHSFSHGAQCRRLFVHIACMIGISTSAIAQVALVNPSFESPALPTGQSLNPVPSGTGWEVRGDVSLANRMTPIWSTSNVQQHGRQWAFLRAGTSISQTLTLQAGTYVVSLQAAQAGPATAAQIKISLGSSSAAPLTPAATLGVMTFAGISIAAAGSYKLTIEVPEPAPGAGFSYGVAVDDVIVGNQGTNTPPSVTIMRPMSGQSIIATTTTLTANVRDPDGTIAKVEFYDGATLVGTAFAPPWNFSLNTNSSLSRTITARAYDNLGASTISDPVYFAHNTGGSFPFVRNGNFESPGLAPASYAQTADSWGIYEGGIATAGAVPPVGSTIGTPAEGLQTSFMTTANGQGQMYQVLNLPAGNHGLSFKLGLAYQHSVTVTLDSTSVTYASSGRQRMPISKTNSGDSTLMFSANSNGAASGMEVLDDVKIGTAGPATISWVSPADLQIYAAPAAIRLAINSDTYDRSITKIEYFANNVLVGTVNGDVSFSSVNWQNVAPGWYELAARVTDSTGASATSSIRTVSVAAGAGYPAFYNAGFEQGASAGLDAGVVGSGWLGYSYFAYASNGASAPLPAPQGMSVAALYGMTTMLQDVHFPAGTFKINFKGAQFSGSISIRVKVNDVVVGTFTPTGSYASYSTNAFTITAPGLKTVRFEGASPGDYNRVGLDDLTISAFTPVGGEAQIPNDPTPTFAVSPSSLTFASQTYGTLSTKTVTVTNTGSTVATLQSLQTNADDYSIPNSCPVQLGVGASCIATVEFVPYAVGTRTGTVTILGVGGATIATIAAAGTGAIGTLFQNAVVPSVNLASNGQSGPSGVGILPGIIDGPGGVDGTKFSGGGPEQAVPLDGPQQVDPIIVTAPWYFSGGGGLPFGAGGGRNSQPVAPQNGNEERILKCFGAGSAALSVPESGSTAIAMLSPEFTPISTYLGVAFDHATAYVSQIALAADPALDIGSNVSMFHETQVGDPIHAAIGNKAHEQTDFQGEGAYGLVFSRVYHTKAPDTSEYKKQNLGQGWYSAWDKTVNLTSAGTSAYATRGNGSTIIFVKQPNDIWLATVPGLAEKLARLSDAGGNTTGWTITNSPVVEQYNAVGRLITIKLADGQVLYSLTYQGEDLKTITQPAGRRLEFGYENGRVKTLTHYAGIATAVTTYSYDSRKRLISVKYPDNRIRDYKYDDPTYLFALTSIYKDRLEADPPSAPYVSFEYFADGRAKRTVFAANAQSGGGYNTGDTSIVFDDVTGSSVTTQATGTTVTRTFYNYQGKIWPTQIQYSNYSASCPACTVNEQFSYYAANSKIASKIDRNGVTTTYTYTTDGRDLLASTTEASNTTVMRTVNTTWHPTFRLPIQVSEPTSTGTKVTNYTYDAAGRTTQTSIVADGQTRTTMYTYNTDGLLTSQKGPRTDVNDTTTYTYFPMNDGCVGCRGQIYTVTNPKGQVSTYNSYDGNGHVLMMTRPNGTTVSTAYDARGRVTSQTDAGQTTTTAYTTDGQIASITDPYGAVTTNLYDSARRLIGEDQSNGEKVRYTLDNAGRTTMTQTFDAQNIVSSSSSTVYDGLNRVLQNIDANGKVTSYAYDANGNVTQVVDPNNLVTSTSYDARNRPILVTDPLLKTVATTYTPDDRIATVRDPVYNTTTYTYNGFGENTLLTSPDTGTTTSSYNAGGLPIARTDARGKTRSYTYDVLGRMTQVTYNDTTIGTSQTYDVAPNGVGQLSNVTDPSGSTSFTYDTYGRVLTKTSNIAGLVRTINYARDGVGRVTSITYPSGNVVGMTYAAGRVTNMTLNGSALISAINYFPLGGPESWLLGPNTTGTQSYLRTIDLNSRIAQYSTPTGYRQLTFDNASRITAIGNYLGASTTANATQSFGYDATGRVTYFSGYTTIGAAQPVLTQTQSFSYDNNGNRTSSTLQGIYSGYTYQPGNNRLASVSGGIVKNNVYDVAGNLTTDGTATYTYDARGRMVNAIAGGYNTNYLIDYRNLRVKKANSGETAHFVYDDAGHMLGEYDGSGTVVKELFWLGDTMVALKGVMPCLTGGGCTETGVAYIWTDHLNTPRELTRVNGSNLHVSLWKWDGLPFGENPTDTNPSNLGTMFFKHRFPGQYRDPETGLHQNWNREYDAVLGRYVTSDPIGLGGGTNTYVYANANAIRNVDRSGLLTTCEETYLNDTYGTLGGFLAKLFNGQQFNPFDPQFAEMWTELIKLGAEKYAGAKAIEFGGKCLYSAKAAGALLSKLGITLWNGYASSAAQGISLAAMPGATIALQAARGHCIDPLDGKRLP